jgi:hypothetical protein
MKLIAALFMIVCLGYISGCTLCSSKKVTCPAFDEPAFVKWFPYNDSSRMVYKNSITADTFSYAISMKSISGTYETTTGGGFGNSNPGCNASAYFASSNYSNSPFGTVGITYTINNSQPEKNLQVYFNNTDWVAGEIFENSFAASVNYGYGVPAKVDSAQNMLFDNGITYSRVVILTNDTVSNKTDRAYKLFIAKNIGIIGCEMFPSKQKWLIQ